MAANNDKTASQDRPSWLDQVLGAAAPAFNFRKGGSMITGGGGDQTSQQSAGAEPGKGRQRG